MRKMSRGSSPLFGSSPETFSGLSGLAKGYEQYKESLTFLRPTTEYGEPSSDDLSSEWESSAETEQSGGNLVTLKEPLALNLALNVARRRKMIPQQEEKEEEKVEAKSKRVIISICHTLANSHV